MIISGVGIDIVDIHKFKRLRNLERIFTKEEISYCEAKSDEYVHLAGRYAVKEAVYKALGIEDSSMPDWKEIETYRERQGRIKVRLKGSFADISENMNIANIEVSLSHTEEIAVAVAIVTSI